MHEAKGRRRKKAKVEGKVRRQREEARSNAESI